MADVVAFEVRVDTGNTVKDLENVKSKIKSVRDDLKLNMDIDTSKLTQFVKDIDLVKSKTVEMNVDVDTKQLDTLRDRIQSVGDKLVNVKVTSDPQSIQEVRKGIDGLSNKLIELKVDTNPETIKGVELQLTKLEDKVVSLTVKTDTKSLDTVKTEIDSVTNKDVTLKVNTDSKSIEGVKTELSSIEDKIVQLRVNPTTEGIAEVERELSALEDKVVRLTVDAESLDTVQSKLDSIEDKNVNVGVTSDTQSIDELQSKVDGVEGKKVEMTVDTNTDSIDGLKQDLTTVEGKTVNVDVKADTQPIETVKSELNTLTDKTVNVSTKTETSNVDQLQSRLDGLKDKLVQLGVVTDTTGIDETKKELDGLKNQDVEVSVNANPESLDTLRGELQSLKDQATSAFEKKDFPMFFELTKQAALAEEKFVKLGGTIVEIPNTVKELNQRIEELSANITAAAASGDDISFTKAVQELTAFETAVKESESGLKLLSESADTEKPVNAIRQLKREILDLTAKSLEAERAGNFLDADKFANEAAKLKDELGDLQKKIDRLDPGAKAQAFARMGETIAAGFAAAQGGAALFGSSGEDLTKVLVKVQGATALLNAAQSITNTIKDAEIVKTVALTTVQSAYNLVIGTSTGALKLFRLALASTGVGAIIVGLGLLITNFDKVKAVITGLFPSLNQIGEKFDKFKQIAVGSLDAIVAVAKNTGKIIVGLLTFDPKKIVDGFSNMGSDAGKAFNDGVAKEVQSQQNDKIIESSRKRVDALKTLSEQSATYYDNEIKLAQAAGRDTVDLEVKKLQAQQNTVNGRIQQLETIKRLNGELTEEEKKMLDELRVAYNQLTVDQNVILTQRNTDEQNKRKEANDKAIEQRKQLNEELNQLQQDVRLGGLPDNEWEIQELEIKYAELREKAKGNNKALEQIESLHQEELKRLRQQQFEDVSSEEYTQSIQKTNEFYEQERVNLQEQLSQKKITEEQFRQQNLQLDVNEKQQLVQIAQDYSNTVKTAVTDLATYELDLKRTTTQQLIDEEKRKQTELQAARDFQNTVAVDEENPDSFEMKLATLTNNMNAELALVEQGSQKEYEIKKKYASLEKQLFDQKAKNQRQAVDIFVGTVNAVGNVISILGKKSEKGVTDEKKLMEIRKKNARVQLFVDQARAIAGGVAAAAGVPFPGNIPAIISTVAAVITNFVAAKKSLAEAGESTGGDVSTGGGGGGTASGVDGVSQQLQTVTTQNVLQPSTLLPTQDQLNQQNQQGQGQQNIEIVIPQGALNTTVSETDVTSQQQRIAMIQNKATFG